MHQHSYLKSILWNFRKILLQFRYFRAWYGGGYYLVSNGFQQKSYWVRDNENRKNKRVIQVDVYADLSLAKRERLWYMHGCEFSALYHDDGEMGCGNCGIDFKRSDLDTINHKLYSLHGNG